MKVESWENKKCKVVGAKVVAEDGELIASCVFCDLAEYVCRAVNLAVELNKQPGGEV